MAKEEIILFWKKEDETVGGPPNGSLNYGEPAVDGDGNLYIGVPDGLSTETILIAGPYRDDSSVTGGLHVVATTTDRDNIPTEARKVGMLALVTATQTTYILSALPNVWNSYIGTGGSGDMLKSVYDTDDDGRVDAAETVNDGTFLTTAEEVSDAYAHISVTGNPHSTTASDVGAIPTSQKGFPNGVAELDGTGKVPATQLPSYVDDVVEYANLAGFPVAGETGKIYVALDTNKTYRWTGSTYVEISPSAVNTVFGRAGFVSAQSGDYNASQVTVTPVGNLAADDVQEGLVELQTDIDNLDLQKAYDNTTTPSFASITVSSSIGPVLITGNTGTLDFLSVVFNNGATINSATHGIVTADGSQPSVTNIQATANASITGRGILTVENDTSNTTGRYVPAISTVCTVQAGNRAPDLRFTDGSTVDVNSAASGSVWYWDNLTSTNANHPSLKISDGTNTLRIHTAERTTTSIITPAANEVIDLFNAGTWRFAQYLIGIKDTTASQFRTTSVNMVIYGGSAFISTEFGAVGNFTTYTLSSDVFSGNARLKILNSGPNNIETRIVRTDIRN